MGFQHFHGRAQTQLVAEERRILLSAAEARPDNQASPRVALHARRPELVQRFKKTEVRILSWELVGFCLCSYITVLWKLPILIACYATIVGFHFLFAIKFSNQMSARPDTGFVA
jgi:hypothetical protein